MEDNKKGRPRKGECSPEILDRLQQMRVKALEVRRAKALTNKKSKLYKAQKDIEKQEEAKQLDEQIKKAKDPKPKPEPD
eukprot:746871-Hanusia_phi.AAC.1